ncbi:MAG: AzlD domain-containing protein [Lachnospiraceae bacterium]|nr:AzlD domain-containing protein [Lachnospiraceae bacterium]
MENNIFIYILIMAAVTYLIRMLPLTLIRKEIKNKTIRSFLYYVPYVTLAVMTFPAILSATDTPVSGIAGFLVALLLAYLNQGLFKVAVGSCLVVFLFELFF